MKPATLAIAVLLLASSAHAAKIERKTLTSKGVQRTYYLFIPDSVTKEHPAPLLITLHGSGRDGKSLLVHWEVIAAKEGIVLAGPDSSDRAGWGSPQDGPVFLRDIVDDVKSKAPIDDRRVYLFGHSAGAAFALQMGLIESEYFAAVAIHAGALEKGAYPLIGFATRKIPFAIFIGDRDPYFPLAGVIATRDEMTKNGFTAELTEMKFHDHDYYSKAKWINEKAWAFLKTRALDKPPKFTVYANM
jgi:poly(3-hydroxybutyrate) depolymerase